MATVAVQCPGCRAWIRPSVQIMEIIRVTEKTIRVKFDDQHVAHICNE